MKCNGMKVVWCAVLAGGLGFFSVQAENVNEKKSDVRGSHCVSEKCATLSPIAAARLPPGCRNRLFDNLCRIRFA